jgi:hypothetical protein
MIKTSGMGRSYAKTASNVAGTVADHNRKCMTLSSASALRSFEYISQLAGAKTGPEVIEFSGAHYRNQLNVLGGYTDTLFELACKMRRIWRDPSERERS